MLSGLGKVRYRKITQKTIKSNSRKVADFVFLSKLLLPNPLIAIEIITKRCYSITRISGNDTAHSMNLK